MLAAVGAFPHRQHSSPKSAAVTPTHYALTIMHPPSDPLDPLLSGWRDAPPPLPEHLNANACRLVDPAGFTLLDAERHTILDALDRNSWRRMATARELGIDKNTLRRKMKRLNIGDEDRNSANE